MGMPNVAGSKKVEGEGAIILH